MPPIPAAHRASENTIEVHEPASTHASLADSEGGFDRGWFMGKWGVCWSTLPMWSVRPFTSNCQFGNLAISDSLMACADEQDKKNVVITYEPHDDSPRPSKFDSTVFYQKQSAADDSAPSTVRGTESLTPGTNGATFDWRGKSYLFFVSSHWEVLGYGQEKGVEWAVTYFSKTLFTPAGVDIYLRTPSSSSPEIDSATKQNLLERVVDAVQRVEPLAALTKDGFQVPGVV